MEFKKMEPVTKLEKDKIYKAVCPSYTELMVVTKIEGSQFEGDTLMALSGYTGTKTWDSDFDMVTQSKNNGFKFYEIGPKEDHPEYFI